ncbi:hypothetical protein SAMN05192583_1584 [Sphingomonas gellani]|uniref:Uncharacterized protein n=1 Tax=Sphingomonas gellani TaxID=1166340 RepID=A0A1H8CHX0_9SPHN|nr:hypothetical protein SAMN05192583_1584 [Sphingomonas gellani]
MTPDQERWAEAIAMHRMHGDRAVPWLAERVGELALIGDEAGVGRFREIAWRLEQLTTQGSVE